LGVKTERGRGAFERRRRWLLRVACGCSPTAAALDASAALPLLGNLSRIGSALPLLVLAVAAAARPALAQTPAPALPGSVQPGRDRPLPEAPPTPNFDFTIEAPRRAPVPRAVDELRFKLRDIHVEGAKALAPDTFRPLYADLIGRDVALADILDVADKIEARYRAAGYLLARAYVPPQHVGDGVFTINVVEGYIDAVNVEGGNDGTKRRIDDYLRNVVDKKPLDQASVERALLLANDLPGVSASGVLRPSPDHPGASDLVVATTAARVSGGIAVDNRESQFNGPWNIGSDIAVSSIFGDADQLGASFAAEPTDLKLVTGQLRYLRPLGNDGLLGSLIGTVTHGNPGGTLAAAGIITDSYAVGPRLTYPLIRSRAQSVILDGGLTVQSAKVLSNGGQVSHDQWRVLDIAATYIQNGFLAGSTAATLDVAQGLPFAGATPNGSPDLSRPDGRTDFTKLVANLRRTQIIAGPVSLAIWAQGQYSFAPLILGEQIAFGGRQIGRGYDPAAVTGDHGVGGSAELRWDQRIDSNYLELVEPYAFYDAGKTWNRHGDAGANHGFASTGGGIRVWLPHSITGDFEIAHTLHSVPGSDNGHRTTKLLMNAAVRF